MGFEPLTFYIAHVHIITVASLPTDSPRIYMPWSLFIAKSVQLFYLQCYYFFLNELQWMNNGIKLLHLFSIGLYPWRTILLLCEIYMYPKLPLPVARIHHYLPVSMEESYYHASLNWQLTQSTIRKYHNRKPQTKPWHRKEEPHIRDFNGHPGICDALKR